MKNQEYLSLKQVGYMTQTFCVYNIYMSFFLRSYILMFVSYSEGKGYLVESTSNPA